MRDTTENANSQKNGPMPDGMTFRSPAPRPPARRGRSAVAVAALCALGLALCGVLPLLTAGCGGGGGKSASDTAATGRVVVTFRWPDLTAGESRAIPRRAKFLRVQVEQGTGTAAVVIQTETRARPASQAGTTETITLNNIPRRNDISFTADAFENSPTDAAKPMATASRSYYDATSIPPGYRSAITLTLSSVITALNLVPVGDPLTDSPGSVGDLRVGDTKRVNVEALDSAEAQILIDPAELELVKDSAKDSFAAQKSPTDAALIVAGVKNKNASETVQVIFPSVDAQGVPTKVRADLSVRVRSRITLEDIKTDDASVLVGVLQNLGDTNRLKPNTLVTFTPRMDTGVSLRSLTLKVTPKDNGSYTLNNTLYAPTPPETKSPETTIDTTNSDGVPQQITFKPERGIYTLTFTDTGDPLSQFMLTVYVQNNGKIRITVGSTDTAAVNQGATMTIEGRVGAELAGSVTYKVTEVINRVTTDVTNDRLVSATANPATFKAPLDGAMHTYKITAKDGENPVTITVPPITVDVRTSNPSGSKKLLNRDDTLTAFITGGTVADGNAYTWTLFGSGNLPQSGVTAAAAVPYKALNNIYSRQALVITGNATGGTFTLTFGTQTTGDIPFNATNSDIETILRGLTNIGFGNVACVGGPLPNRPVAIQFQGALANNDKPLAVNSTNLVGDPAPVAKLLTEPRVEVAVKFKAAYDSRLIREFTNLTNPPTDAPDQSLIIPAGSITGTIQ